MDFEHVANYQHKELMEGTVYIERGGEHRGQAQQAREGDVTERRTHDGIALHHGEEHAQGADDEGALEAACSVSAGA
ncbi:hypothetical protein ABT131_29900 [Streptomyces sp900105245]|uniref:hypothetical protein n=1 Tax=Streptomyces sp. 900105245 TaxID=3154379 RepID=UPI00331733A8